jgi:hypothetical protein
MALIAWLLKRVPHGMSSYRQIWKNLYDIFCHSNFCDDTLAKHVTISSSIALLTLLVFVI